ncbi:MAG: hypothetical protein IKS54_11510 [Erysipelotrichaceae bacterium]|nr:hypothetical protein [Erysipelotrichaceae bacterium]
MTVNCPYCGQAMAVESEGEPTCTQGVQYWAYCQNESCPGRDPVTLDYYETSGIAPALGHDYNAIIEVEATCTESGVTRYTCSRCGDTYRSYPEALGHDYRYKVTKEATCTEDGVRTYTCTRCKDKYTRKITKLGHDIKLEEKEATCTEDGYKRGKCSRCDEAIDEFYPALGHDMVYTVTKTPTCTEDGEREGVCSRCGEKVTEKILAPGHKYPAEWTREKEPSYTEEGLESKTCYYCGNKITQPIPKLDATPIVAGGGAVAAAAGGGLWLYLKKLRAAKYAKQAIKGIRKFEKPSFEDRSVMVSSKFEDLMNVLKEKSFLEVTSCEDGEIEESIEEAGPDLLILDVLSEERLEELLKQKEEALADYPVGVVTTEEFIADHKEQLDQLVKDKKILNYISYGSDANKIMLKLIAPILKPDIKSDESLGNIGAVADFIGIPAVSTLIDVYVSGRDIKSTLESDEIGMSEAATIIGDLASILGYDGVASVAGLVDDVDSVKAALDKEAGAYEGKNAISGAKDIVEVVSDIIDKD